MFAKLKKQVKEKADDVATTETSAVRKATENSRQKAEDETTKSQRQRIKSNSVSADENQSSDERSSTKSSTQTKTTTTITTATESNKETNSNETSSVQSESNDSTINNQNQSDNSYKTQLQQLNQSLLNQIDLLANELKEKLKENEELREITLQLNSKIDEYENEIKLLKNDKDELIIRNAELSEKYELLKQVNAKQLTVAAQLPIDHNSSDHQHKNRSHSESTVLIESQIPSVQHTTTTTTTTSTNSTIQQQQTNIPSSSSASINENNESATKALRDELNEKNKVIKNLQQRLNDLKKTLQKELKYQQLPNESISSSPSTNHHQMNHHIQNQSHQMPPMSPLYNRMGSGDETSMMMSLQQSNSTSQKSVVNGDVFKDMKRMSIASAGGSASATASSAAAGFMMLNGQKKLDDVNNKYLKHVILKFLTSREYEALHLVKAISVLLNFTSEEEAALRKSLEWKMSWFGTKPKINNLT